MRATFGDQLLMSKILLMSNTDMQWHGTWPWYVTLHVSCDVTCNMTCDMWYYMWCDKLWHVTWHVIYDMTCAMSSARPVSISTDLCPSLLCLLCPGGDWSLVSPCPNCPPLAGRGQSRPGQRPASVKEARPGRSLVCAAIGRAAGRDWGWSRPSAAHGWSRRLLIGWRGSEGETCK